MLLQQVNILLLFQNYLCFNTTSGRCCCLITFVLPSLCSGTWDVRTSSSLCSSAVSHPSAHTVNGRYCCNYGESWSWHSIWSNRVSIPKTVGTVTLSPLFYLLFVQVLEMCGHHRRFAPLPSRTLRRIPQAVGVVATRKIIKKWLPIITAFQYRKR